MHISGIVHRLNILHCPTPTHISISINLEILNSICALLDIFPEREECEEIYLLANELFNNLNDIFIWPILYIKFELLFIE